MTGRRSAGLTQQCTDNGMILQNVQTGITAFECPLSDERKGHFRNPHPGLYVTIFACGAIVQGPWERSADCSKVRPPAEEGLQGAVEELSFLHGGPEEGRAPASVLPATDLSMLKLFEAFLESVPQLLLQIYIVLRLGRGHRAVLCRYVPC
ncbi:hypothetical protein KUCAC02_034735, partial [Chaenocephalus aceratus]